MQIQNCKRCLRLFKLSTYLCKNLNDFPPCSFWRKNKIWLGKLKTETLLCKCSISLFHFFIKSYHYFQIYYSITIICNVFLSENHSLWILFKLYWDNSDFEDLKHKLWDKLYFWRCFCCQRQPINFNCTSKY